MNMRTALIGHRGVGKTSLLERIRTYHADAGRKVECFDLDAEIERRTRRSVQEIFAGSAEAEFRRIERETFSALDQETLSHKCDVFVALGAGFDPSAIPDSWRALWVRRPTDALGRVFTDRPRLNPEKPPFVEYVDRFAARDRVFRARADEVLILDEGLEGAESAERGFILGDLRDLGGALTVMPGSFRNEASFETWVAARIAWGIRWFELRDDLLNEKQMGDAIRHLPEDRVLVSLRDKKRLRSSVHFIERQNASFDWPVEFGAPPAGRSPTFLSLHERRNGETLAQALARFPVSTDSIFKAALPVRDFHELEEAHAWWSAFPDGRVILPMSDDGRWGWYRLRSGGDSQLGFFRESEGSSFDQPTLLQWIRQRVIDHDSLRAKATARNGIRYAAVLGDPVRHSRTPMEHREFFARIGAPVYAIRMARDEWSEHALEFLRSLGMTWAAVTAPHKEHASALCSKLDRVAEELRAVNTLQWDERRKIWEGVNTDREGFSTLIDGLKIDRATVWGGGGTLAMIRSVLPQAEFFSSRTGENRTAGGRTATDCQPETVLWAAGAEGASPPETWRPKLVIDLNYAENSPAREFAMSRGSRYVSGLRMFRVQAELQREFWDLEPVT